MLQNLEMRHGIGSQIDFRNGPRKLHCDCTKFVPKSILEMDCKSSCLRKARSDMVLQTAEKSLTLQYSRLLGV